MPAACYAVASISLKDAHALPAISFLKPVVPRLLMLIQAQSVPLSLCLWESRVIWCIASSIQSVCASNG